MIDLFDVLISIAVCLCGLAGIREAYRRIRAAEALAQQFEELYLAGQEKLETQAEQMLRVGQEYRQEMERGDKLAAANETLREQIRQLRQPQEQPVRMLAQWRFSRN